MPRPFLVCGALDTGLNPRAVKKQLPAFAGRRWVGALLAAPSYAAARALLVAIETGPKDAQAEAGKYEGGREWFSVALLVPAAHNRPVMRINFTLTKGDIWQYHWYAWRRRFLFRLASLLGLCLLLPCLTFIPRFSASIGYGFAPSAALGVVLFFIQLISLLLRMALGFWKASKSGITGERVAEVSKFDFCWGETEATSYHHHWANFEDIVNNRGASYFILPGEALIVPKSAFVTSSESQKFSELSHEHWETAKMNQRHALTAGEGVWPPPPRIGA